MELSIEMVYTSASVLTTDEKYGLRETRQKKYGVPRDNYWLFIYSPTFH
jgi:hypothetical protein